MLLTVLAVAALAVLAVLGWRWLALPNPNSPVAAEKLAAPSSGAPLGRDQLGRDVLSRLLHGGGFTIGLSLAATAVTAVFGTAAALLAGYRGERWAAQVLEVFNQTLLAVPSLWLPLVAVAFFGSSSTVLVIALVLISFPNYYWVLQRDVRALSRQPFVEAAALLGYRLPRVLFRELLPHVRRPVLLLGLLNLRHTVLTLSTLAFLGLGPGVSTPTWGLMISEGRPYFPTFWWVVAWPSVALILTVALAGVAARHVGRLPNPLVQVS